jgi:nucleoside-diphosphate-sugar epimerase
MKKVLFLGGSGFLGQHLIRSFSPDVKTFAIARSLQSVDRVKNASSSIEIVSADEAARIRFDRIFNLVVDYGRGGASLSQLIQPNLIYPLKLLETIEADVVLNVSTALPQNYSNYALSKKLLEQSLQFLQKRKGRPFLNVHLHNMYGPGAEVTEFVGFIVTKMLADQVVDVSECRNSRDFVFVDDVVSALSHISANPQSFLPNSAVEIGTGKPTCLRELVSMVQELTGSRSEIRFGAKPSNQFEPEILVANTHPLEAVGWAPRHPLRQGLEATIKGLASRPQQVAEPI